MIMSSASSETGIVVEDIYHDGLGEPAADKIGLIATTTA